MDDSRKATREAFEAWARANGFALYRSDGAEALGGAYPIGDTQDAWISWQAAVEWSRSQALEEAAQVCEASDTQIGAVRRIRALNRSATPNSSVMTAPIPGPPRPPRPPAPPPPPPETPPGEPGDGEVPGAPHKRET